MERPSPSPEEVPDPRHDIELPEQPPGEYPSQNPPEIEPPPGTPQVDIPTRSARRVAGEHSHR